MEEWYHTCLVPDYVNPEDRPPLTEELDWLLPELLEMLAEARCSATFFVLGEVAERLPRRIREIVAAGHEVASHGHLHLRACERSLEAFQADIERSKEVLEDVTGEPVLGFRAPEWSLRSLGSARLPIVAEAGFLYDSSLTPCPLAGRPGNPRFASRLRWNGTGPQRVCSSSRRSPSAVPCVCRRGAGRAAWSTRSGWSARRSPTPARGGCRSPSFTPGRSRGGRRPAP